MSALSEQSAGCIVERREKGKALFLLLQSPAGVWGFPKGKIEKGEQKRDTARRELFEETGIRDFFFIPGFSDSYRYAFIRNGRRIRKTVALFAGETSKKRVRLSHEHVAHAWLTYEPARKKLTFKNTKEMLDRAHVYHSRARSLLETQRKLYDLLRRVPKGKVITYQKAARALHVAPRTVGALLSLNYDRRIPCHRVVFSDGNIGGYNRGVNAKALLLKKEGMVLEQKGGALFAATPHIIG